MVSNNSSHRVLAKLIALATCTFAFGAPESAHMFEGQDDEQPDAVCGRDCITGITAGIVGLVCISIVILCVWSSRTRRT
ncbi:hypothetical protein ANO14919_064950 [Xylariales sp. No.14919]|nr:hypothetical protein ANO14919_064950 [Xylariales sp. No.14919]